MPVRDAIFEQMMKMMRMKYDGKTLIKDAENSEAVIGHELMEDSVLVLFNAGIRSTILLPVLLGNKYIGGLGSCHNTYKVDCRKT